jgi:hypothetical protein
MMRGVINIIVGLVLIIGGLSGGLVMRGTQSGVLIAIVGFVILGIGVFRLARRQ